MKYKFTYCFAVILSVFISFGAFAQPANDDCTGAIPITVEGFGSPCSATTAAVTTGATFSGIVETNCTSTTVDLDDIFYTFVATGSEQILRFSGMVATSGTATTLGFRIYEGTCGSLTQMTSCSVGFGATGAGSYPIAG